MSTTGECLFGALEGCLAEFDLSLSECIGYGSDGASNMVGIRNSVWTRIQQESPHCMLFKCICHSLALCVARAFEGLPSNLGFLIGEIPTWFSRSSLRREEYKDIFYSVSVKDENTNNESNDGSSCKLPFLTLCPTRWLVRGEVLQRILSNWNDLKAYFSSATFDQESNFKGRILKDMLVDDLTYLYICFITPIIKEFDKINKFFQATNADPEAMTQQLEMHYRSLRGRVFDIDGNQLSISRVDLGAKFESESLHCIRKHEASDFSTHLIKVKERCRMFLQELIAQIEQRLPTNRNIFAGLSFLKPSKVLSHVNRPAFHNLPFQNMLHDSDDVDEIEEQ